MKIEYKRKAVLYWVFIFLITWIHLTGQSWTPQGIGLLPVGYRIWSISAVNDSIVWVTASHIISNTVLPTDHLAIVLHSTDGGNTWKTHYVEESLGRMSFDIKGVDANTAWLTTQGFSDERGRAIYKTEDAGMTWQKKLFAHVGGVFIQVIDKNHIYCQNNKLKAWSKDGGDTWNQEEIEGYEVDHQYNRVISGNNMSSANGDTVWVGTSKGNIVRTTAYGDKSEILNTGIPASITSVSFKDSRKGMLFFNYDSCCTSGIARTFDGGTSWQLTPSKFETFGYYNITCIPGKEDVFIATPVSYAMSEYFWTYDFGESWISGGTINNAYTNCTDFSSTSIGWVATDIILSEFDPLLYKWKGESFSTSNKAAIATTGPVPNLQLVVDPFIYSNPKLTFTSNYSSSKIPTAQSIINTFRYRKRYELLYGTNLVRFYSKAVEARSGLAQNNSLLLAQEKRKVTDVLEKWVKERQKKKIAFASMTTLMLLSGIGFYFFWKRKKSHNERKLLQERLRISRELHDEVGATLSGISMYSHVAVEQLKSSNTKEVEHSLNFMQSSAGEMVNKLSDIVWLLNPEQDTIMELFGRLGEYGKQMTRVRDMQIRIDLPTDLSSKHIPLEARRNIYLFCKEAINNAVKYSNGRLLVLQVKSAGYQMVFSVTDDGNGFDESIVRRGNGLVNMQKRAQDIGAEFHIDTKANQGTRLELQYKIIQ